MDETDVLIIGGGVTGLCAALDLVRRGRRVLVVERREIGAGASGNNAGSCAIQNKLHPLIPLAREAVRLWQDLKETLRPDGLDLAYVRCGGLKLAETPEEVETLTRTGEEQRARGAPVTFLTGAEAREVAPYLGPSVAAANWCAEDGFCDVLHAMAALSKAVATRGGVLWRHTDADRIEPSGTGCAVRTSRGVVRADRVIVAAGLWSRDLAGTLGIPVPLTTRINILSATRRAAPVMSHMISHASHLLTMKQLPVGTVMIGGGWQGIGEYRSYAAAPTFESLMGNWAMAARAVPALRQVQVLRSWASFDGRTPDNMPLIGGIPAMPGVFIGACCPGGWTIGPFIGAQLAAMACGDPLSPLVSPFAPNRFAHAAAL